jgi:DNA-binding NarL/FixJ family response regulator
MRSGRHDVKRVRVAVWDPLPIYRRGIMIALSDVEPHVEGWEEANDFLAPKPNDLLAWSARSEISLVLVTVESTDSWKLITDLKRLESKPIILAVLVNATVDSYVRAMAMGAISAVARDASAELIRQVAVEALHGRSLLPSEVVGNLVGRLGAAQSAHRPLDRDVEWLRALAQGIPIVQVAASAGYSERAMYRLLRDLYRRMGVRNRTEAVLLAMRSGWL